MGVYAVGDCDGAPEIGADGPRCFRRTGPRAILIVLDALQKIVQMRWVRVRPHIYRTVYIIFG